MNRDVMEGKWKQFRGKVRENWGQLTDDELDQAKGNWDQLVGKIQERTGETREDIETRLDEMSREFEEEPANVRSRNT